MPIILFRGEEQKEKALLSRSRIEENLGKTVHTDIKELKTFHPAESYHQKYFLQLQGEIYRELKGMFPDRETLFRSQTAAKINGYLRGYGSPEELKKHLPLFGLSSEAQRALKEIYSSINQ